MKAWKVSYQNQAYYVHKSLGDVQLLNAFETFSYIQHGMSMAKKNTYLPTEPRKKQTPTFHYTGWLIEILINVYDNPNIIGQFFIPYEHIL